MVKSSDNKPTRPISRFKSAFSTKFQTYTLGTVVQIRHKYIKLWYCFFLIICCTTYTLFFWFIFKSQLYTCEADGIASTRIQGAVLTNYTKEELNVPNYELYNKLWDSQDLLTPPEIRQMEDFTVLTNVLITPNQVLKKCPENPCCNLECTKDSDCNPKLSVSRTPNGVLTGKCVAFNTTHKGCEIYGWCPVPAFDTLPLNGKKALLEDTKNLFVVIKSAVEFPLCGQFRQTNVPDSAKTWEYFRDCFNSKKDPWCPKFRLKDIVEGAGENFAEVAIRGAAFTIRVEWDCYLPYWTKYDGLDSHCRPKYKFSRDLSGTIKLIAPGWKYICGNYAIQTGGKRTHQDCYGLKFTISVTGKGYIFTWKTFILDTVLSSSCLFFLPSLLIEILLFRFFFNKDYRKKIKVLRKRKVEDLDDDDDDEQELKGNKKRPENVPLNTINDDKNKKKTAEHQV